MRRRMARKGDLREQRRRPRALEGVTETGFGSSDMPESLRGACIGNREKPGSKLPLNGRQCEIASDEIDCREDTALRYADRRRRKSTGDFS